MLQATLPKKREGFLRSSTLMLIAFATAFFPRIVESLGLPAIINFLHFAVVPVAVGIVIVSARSQKHKQLEITRLLLIGAFILLTVMTASALLNNAGIINLLINYLILAEPYIFLAGIICIPLSSKALQKIRFWLMVFAASNLVIAIVQYHMMVYGFMVHPVMTLQDNVQGVFYLSGAGNYVSAAVSLSFALYFFFKFRHLALWIRVLVLLAAFYQTLLSDSKQVLLTFIAAWLILVLTKVGRLGRLIAYLIGAMAFISIAYWAVMNIDFEGFAAYKWWLSRTSLYAPDGEGTQAKMAGINVVLAYSKTPANWLLGLGPGHTIGRLGGWSIREYWNLLEPLGATRHPVSAEGYHVMTTNWLVLESSLFSPMFTWGGIWGDQGFLGLLSYLFLGYVTWKLVCKDDLSRFLVLTIIVFGLILTQMEEPGQMLTIAAIIGLRWHELQPTKRIPKMQSHGALR
jgi:hypothetical protein